MTRNIFKDLEKDYSLVLLIPHDTPTSTHTHTQNKGKKKECATSSENKWLNLYYKNLIVHYHLEKIVIDGLFLTRKVKTNYNDNSGFFLEVLWHIIKRKKIKENGI